MKLFLATTLALLVTACAPTPEAVDASAANAPAASVSAPFDVQAITRRVRRSFRLEQGRFTSVQGTYALQVGREGTLRFTARPGDVSAVDAAPLELRTAAISQDGHGLPRAVRAEVREDGALALHRGEVVEVLENTDEGLEQRWEWAQRPAGDGDLEVQVEVAGLEYVGETAGGHHYADRGSGLGVRYGQATWVDARGARTAVRTLHDAGGLRIRVPRAVLESSSWPAVLDPIISPEISPDAPVPAPSSLVESSPGIAYTQGVFLVTWDVLLWRHTDVVAARVRASDGVLLDVSGILLAGDGGASESFPTVAAQDGTFLVAWRASPGGAQARRVRASDGQVLDAAPLQLSASDASGVNDPSAACAGNICGVFWADSTRIRGVRLRLSDGELLGSTVVAMESTRVANALQVAADETQFLVVWSTEIAWVTRSDDVRGARVRASDGVVLDSTPLVISNAPYAQSQPFVAHAGGLFLVAWRDARSNDGNEQNYGARVRAADGAVLDPSGLLLSTSEEGGSDAVLSTDGTDFLMVWVKSNWKSGDPAYWTELRAARVSQAGVRQPFVALQRTTTSHHLWNPAVAFGESHFLLAWTRREVSDPNKQDIYGAWVRASDLKMPEPVGILLSQQSNYQASPAMAWSSGGRYLVVWADFRANSTTGSDLYGVRVSAEGTVLDSPAIRITAGSGSEESPQVVSDGTDFLVVWRTPAPSLGIRATRVRGSDGVVLDPQGISISGPQNSLNAATVAFGAGHYFVVWSDKRNGSDYNLQGVRLRASDGQVIDPTVITVSNAPQSQSDPSVAFGAGSFFVVWTDSRHDTPNGYQFDIYGARVRATDGVVLDPAGIALSLAERGQSRPVVAFDGNNFLTVWSDLRWTGKPSCEFYATRVRASTGEVLDPQGLSLCPAPSGKSGPSLTFDGEKYFLTWEQTQLPAAGIHGARLKPDGTVVNEPGFLIHAEARWLYPRAAASAPGKYLVTYVSYDKVARTDRIKLRRVSGRLEGESCASAAECVSGSCVEGTCCESACPDGTCGSGTCQYPPAVIDIQCPGTVTAEATGPQGNAVNYPPATATGREPLTVTYSHASGARFPLGTTSVTAQVKDGLGRTASCVFPITVRDTTAPMLTCPADVSREAMSTQGMNVTYAAATASDTVSAVTLGYSQASGSLFEVGTTAVTVSATDAAGNTATCGFTVTVTLPPAPQVSCPGTVTAEATGPQGAVVSYPAATATGTEPLTVTYSHASGTRFALGTTLVTAQVRDAFGRTVSCAIPITVRDTTAPVLTCPANVSAVATSTQGATVTYPSATAFDAVSAVTLAYSQASGSFFEVGTTAVTASATDAADNLSTCRFTVTVTLPPTPQMSCPGAASAEATGPQGAIVNYPAATATGTEPLTVTYSQAPGTRFALGTTSVTAQVTDGLGRTASCAFPITVQDTTAPSLSCPADIQVEDAPGQGLPVTYPGVTASDAVSPPVLSYSHASGGLFPVGTTQVTVKATDAAGQSSTCSFLVQVKPGKPVQPDVPVEPSPSEPRGGGCSVGLGASEGLGWMVLLMLLSWSPARRRPSPSRGSPARVH